MLPSEAARPSPTPYVLVFTGAFLPGSKAGGPVRSLDALTDIPNSPIGFRVVTADRDLGDDRPYPTVRLSQWVRLGPRLVWYWPKRDIRGSLSLLSQIRRSGPSLYYFNSLWSFRFTLLPLILVQLKVLPRAPILIATRGETLPGALSSKRIKKRIALPAVTALVNLSDATLQATSEMESDSLQRMFPRLSVISLPNLFRSERDITYRQRQGTPHLKLVTASRIHPHKNLKGALRALAKSGRPVHLRVIGEPEDGAYYEECRSLAEAMPAKMVVDFVGHLEHSDVKEELEWADGFISLTKSENFGHAIRESLAAGCVPIVSSSTPWSPLIAKMGQHTPNYDDEEVFSQIVTKIADLTPEDRSALGQQVQRQYAEWADEGESNRADAVEKIYQLSVSKVVPAWPTTRKSRRRLLKFK